MPRTELYETRRWRSCRGPSIRAGRGAAFAPFALALAMSAGPACGRTFGAATDPCSRTHGMWQGEGLLVEGDAGRDPDAVRVVSEMLRGERWRITRVTPNAMQRERQGLIGGAPVGEAMYLRENANGRCVVELQTPRSGSRTITLTPHADGTLDVLQQGGWYTARYRRP